MERGRWDRSVGLGGPGCAPHSAPLWCSIQTEQYCLEAGRILSFLRKKNNQSQISHSSLGLLQTLRPQQLTHKQLHAVPPGEGRLDPGQPLFCIPILLQLEVAPSTLWPLRVVGSSPVFQSKHLLGDWTEPWCWLTCPRWARLGEGSRDQAFCLQPGLLPRGVSVLGFLQIDRLSPEPAFLPQVSLSSKGPGGIRSHG